MKNNSAKFAFFYMLSLVALIFMALSTGMIIFQIINKYIVDVINQYSGRFESGALKFAISAVIISTPIYYFTTKQIFKNLREGKLDRESGVRRWLSYFILFISSVVMIGWLISVINSFLDGELTTKFFLKAFTALAIAASIFTFYYYDIKRKDVTKKDKVIQRYYYISLIVIIITFVTSLFVVESPTQTRNRKLDEAVLRSFHTIHSALGNYYEVNGQMPETLEQLKSEYNYISKNDLKNRATGEEYKYKISGEKGYELCATFKSSNENEEDEKNRYSPFEETWPHGVGYKCFSKKIRAKEFPEAVRVPMKQ